MKYYAHSHVNKDQEDWHLLQDHLLDTAKLAAEFSSAFGAMKLGYTAGILHDIGKYSIEFQERLKGSPQKVDHSTAGTQVAIKEYPRLGKILAYLIAGHHSGLPNGGSREDESSLEGRLMKDPKRLPNYSPYKREIRLPGPEKLSLPKLTPLVSQGFSLQFFIRFLFSCLVDADYLDTERALNPLFSLLRGPSTSLEKLSKMLNKKLMVIQSKAANTKLNHYRAKIMENCREKASYPPGLFSLTVPTGGGKTLSSMAFALNHAFTNGQKRIIYVIPYTSIIEQNASVFRSILGDENILEHHSNYTHPNENRKDNELDYHPEAQRWKLASQNWDAPIVVTTNVQFFESLFASKTSRCRKLHRLANSVIILDEAQMLPTEYLKPSVSALVELMANYQSTVVLCTATQPALTPFLPPEIKPIEIIEDPEQLYLSLKRVQVNHLGDVPLPDHVLVEKLLSHQQVLCIVNSKKHARILFEKIQGKGAFHLSTRMCPAHRTKVLQTIKERLRTGETCRVISTQLLEAGVDVDFPTVYRSLAGIDSIAQAAGRCNREGLRDKGEVFVFMPRKHGLPKGWLSRTAAIGNGVLKRHQDPLHLDAVADYFKELYDVEREGLDQKGIMAMIREQEQALLFPFRRISDAFQLIDEETITVIIPWDDRCRRLLDEARKSEFLGTYLKKLQRYSVQVYEKEWNQMLDQGMLEEVGGTLFILREELFYDYYHPEMGLLPVKRNRL